ncbi:hypothetical protein FJZ23_01405 [Candidatus Parcubacteria bacterium]|nr:hypothetical protein [Candidatus Parcubacteria bacterium]
MGHLNSFDREVIQQLRAASVLADCEALKLQAPTGVIAVSCSDGDQMPDVFEHLCALERAGGWPVRPHLLSLHGGAMLLAKGCPLYREFRADELLLTHIREAEGPALKGIGTVVLSVHAPCGAAAIGRLTLVQQLSFLMQAKARVKAIDTTNQVVCFVHVDFGDRKRTYFLSRTKWKAYWEEHGRHQWGHLVGHPAS